MKEFKLNHTVLYAKKWYARNADGRTIWQDLQKTISADGYSGELMDKYDIVTMILDECQNLGTRPFELLQFANGISKENCWRNGYAVYVGFGENTKQLPEYDYWESIVRYCLCHLSITETSKLGIKLTRPDFEKCLPPQRQYREEELSEIFG